MENKFMRVEEVAAELGVSASYAYKVIRRLNDELKAKGFSPSEDVRQQANRQSGRTSQRSTTGKTAATPEKL